MASRVWIELEQPPGSRHDIGHARAKLACNMLRRLGDKHPEPVFWHEKKHRYCFTIDLAGSFVEAGDNGHWYNLEYFGRACDET